MNHHKYTYEQVSEIFTLTLLQYSVSEICEKTKLPYHSVVNARRVLRSYEQLSSKKLEKKAKNSTYAQVVYESLAKKKHYEKTIEQPPERTERTESREPIVLDRYQKLEQAFTNFQEVITEFVVSEVEERGNFLIQENERINKENRELRETIQEGKLSNWVNNLKKKFETR